MFLACPSDLAAERACVHRVVQRLKVLADQLALMLEVVDWSSQVVPFVGRPPQEGILEQIPADSWDVFIGLLWLRFGTPTGAVDAATGRRFESGTEEEFTRALESWKATSRPRILFYRCLRRARPDQVDADQLKQVQGFFQGFDPGGAHPGLYQTFGNAPELEQKVNDDLTRLLFDFHREALDIQTLASGGGSRDGGPSQPPEGEGAPSGERPYPMSVLSVEIVGHREIVDATAPAPRAQLDRFESFILNAVRERRGSPLAATPGRRLFAFSGERRCDRAALAGIEMIKFGHLLKQHPDQNSLRIPIGVRLAATDGLVELNASTTEMAPVQLALSLANHLESVGEQVGEFFVTESLQRGLKTLTSAFASCESLQGVSVHKYLLGSSGPGSEMVFSEFGREINEKVARLLKLFDDGPIASRELLSASLDSLYSAMDFFCSYLETMVDDWPAESIGAIGDHVRGLLDTEEAFAKRLRDMTARGLETDEVALARRIAGSRRAGPRVRLARLKGALDSTATVKALIDATDDMVKALVNAPDELAEHTALAELMAHGPDGLIATLSPDDPGQHCQGLVDRLWRLADLVLAEDIAAMRGGEEVRPRRFEMLQQDQQLGPRFRVVQYFLTTQNPPSRPAVEAQCAEEHCSMGEADVAVVQRCILVAHPDPEIRRLVAMEQPLDALFVIASYHRMPVAILASVGERFNSSGATDDDRKNFFACVGSRLSRVLKQGEEDLAPVEDLIAGFFKWDFFVEEAYFEYLEKLHAAFQSRAAPAGRNVAYLDEALQGLSKLRHELGSPETRIPNSIGTLPLPVLRHLAREAGWLVYYFVLHPDYRIAKETLPYINIGNVEGILSYRQINGWLLGEILMRMTPTELAKRSTLDRALGNPKCPEWFARKNLWRLDRRALERLAGDVVANPMVRSLARHARTRQ